MNKIIVIAYLSGIGLYSKAQTPTDTVKVIINGQSATIENNGTGKKTTLTFEDSSNVFQVSVIKFNKNNWPPKDNQKFKLEEPRIQARTTRWFGEGTIGLVMNPFTKQINNSIFQHDYYNNFYYGTGTITLISYQKINPGYRLELFIKEKRRELNKKGLSFITGSRLQYNHSSGLGTGLVKTYKTDSMHNILYDSLISSSTLNIKSHFRNFKFCVPLLFEQQYNIKNKALSFQGGILLGINVNFTRVIETSGPNKGETSFMGYDGANFISVQPTIRMLYNRFSLNLTYDLNKSKFGSDAHPLVSNPLCFGIGYRFY